MAADYASLSRQLAQMTGARQITARAWETVERQIRDAAEARTIKVRAKKRYQFGRHASTWTPADEREFTWQCQAIQFTRAGELVAIGRKLARQDAALAAFRAKHRRNEPEALAA